MRYRPEMPLPPYAHHPGKTPHPTSHPKGHFYQQTWPGLLDLNHDDWRACPPYLFGFDLYNHGFFWEAHEVWEALWHQCGRSQTPAGQVLQALICLTGSQLKNKMEENLQSQRLLKKAQQYFLICDAKILGLKDLSLTEPLQEIKLYF